MLLNYLHTYQNATIKFHTSDMKLYVDSDAMYHVATKAKSKIAGYFIAVIHLIAILKIHH